VQAGEGKCLVCSKESKQYSLTMLLYRSKSESAVPRQLNCKAIRICESCLMAAILSAPDSKQAARLFHHVQNGLASVLKRLTGDIA
jgi:hypothetical protein